MNEPTDPPSSVPDAGSGLPPDAGRPNTPPSDGEPAKRLQIFLSCVSAEFRSYRLQLANHLGALRGQPYEIKVQEDFQQGGHTLLDKLADYIRDCDLVIHLSTRTQFMRRNTRVVDLRKTTTEVGPPT